MEIKRVCIVGAGLMGSGIAQVCASAGLKVILFDVAPEAVGRALKNIAWSAGKFVEKQKVDGPVEAIMARITATDDLARASEADLCIEAVFEKLDLKQEVFRKLGSVVNPETMLASNTSAISISTLAAGVPCPERVLGLHFFSPVPMMEAVEVVRSQFTSDEVFDRGKFFVKSIGKEPILVHKDVPGFLINRINFPATIEAMRLVEAGVGTVEDIDKGLRLASGRRMGIFETGDMVGLDVTCGALTAIYEETKDPRWFPPAVLRRKVMAGHLGRKTGKGWYEYNPDGTRKPSTE
ncbi:MAG: 3-hydroxyacyl-CoA dehydrogenase family protein [Desulfomonile tiedjei]|uniref:3-hydroxyacyl-CoA dehydrogenase family protein n=1 Tax=Desulfomonile tiedjei TaxID=2358 RepID=A0A9D6Z5I4_9BACT|nr:3-hydroxyacyl-CoA dehydrogenase family protein [Desulfomonile tiedjei]